jgi:hypothetical protein
MATCPECRQLVLELSSVGDQLLTLAPTHEPPVGFESRVISALKLRKSRARRWAAAGAAAVLAATLGAAGVLLVTADERGVAARYQAALERAGGRYFAVWDLRGPSSEKAGNVFGYEGHPSWVFVTIDDVDPGTYVPEIVAASGDVTRMDAFAVTEGKHTWGTALEMNLKDVAEFRMLRDGQTVFKSAFREED